MVFLEWNWDLFCKLLLKQADLVVLLSQSSFSLLVLLLLLLNLLLYLTGLVHNTFYFLILFTGAVNKGPSRFGLFLSKKALLPYLFFQSLYLSV